MPISTAKELPKALLVSIRTPDVTDNEAQDSLDELERLVTTLGFRVVGKESQRLPSSQGISAVGSGKLKELARLTKADPDDERREAATVVVFDCELRPAQLRHIENGLGVEVLDRPGVIIEIFSRHAKTRAAKLQVEIARLNYQAPRLREVGSSGERQQGRGSGESALDTGRRAIRDRLAELKKELAKIQKEESEHRQVRAQQLTVALVGYTNAGKSSTMRALTGSDVLVEDKLFATLDTTVRALKPETKPRILVTDTVGFIKKLPHDLVASFRSTLDESLNASLLLYVVDAADPGFREQLTVVEDVLRETGVKRSAASLLVLNKADRLDAAAKKKLQREFPDAVMSSALRMEDVKNLRDRIIEHFEKRMEETEIFAPYEKAAVVGEIRATLRVLGEKHEEKGTRYRVRALPEDLARVKQRLR